MVVAVVVTVIVALSVGGGYALSAFLYNSDHGASVKILSDELAAYVSQDLSQPLDETVTIDFGEMWPGDSASETFYIKNLSGGNSKIKPQIAVQGLFPGMSLSEKTFGKIPSDGSWLDLYTSASVKWTPSGVAASVKYSDVTVNANQIIISTGGIASAGFVKIHDEIIRYTGTSLYQGNTCLVGVTRGMCGTTPVAHLIGSTIYWGTAEEIQFDALNVGEVQAVELILTAGDETPDGELSFNILMQATSQH
jgi:hypothetical protein